MIADRYALKDPSDNGLVSVEAVRRAAAIDLNRPWVLQLTDKLGLVTATMVPALVAASAGPGSAASELLTATVVAGLWFACISVALAATRTTLGALGPLAGVARGTAVAAILTTALGVWFPIVELRPLAVAGLAVAVLVLATAWETFAVRRLRPPLRLLLVGPREACDPLARELVARGDRRFTLAGVVVNESRANETGRFVVGSISNFSRVVESARPDLVALVPGCDRPAVFPKLVEAASSGFRVLELPQFYEYAFGRVPLRDLPEAWFMSVMHAYQRPYSRLAKRSVDLVGGALLLLLFAPLLPLLALMVRLTPGPVILRQSRLGEHGRPFTIYKFRTMRADAEKFGHAVWAVENDPRITLAGRVMRRLRLDELPQIWNVVRGEMSIVGPRPERPEFVDQLLEAMPFWTRRHLVRPGLTGWAQVNRGYAADTEGSLEKLSFDLWYVRHRSLTVDLVICFRTLAAVVRGERPAAATAASSELEQPLLALVRNAIAGQLDATGV